MLSGKSLLLLALLAAAALNVGAAQQPATPAAVQPAPAADPRIDIARRIPGGARAEELRATPIPGIWELTRGGEIAYVSADGKYAISGDLVDLGTNTNITEGHRREVRVRMLAAVPESDMVIFGPKDPKYTVTVFTDVDCPYCRKLHSEIAEYNALGVRVRYLPYPRTGPNSPSWTRAEQVWCSVDRSAALTRAKLGEDIKTKVCANNPVARSWDLGQTFEIQGTPAIVMADGEMLPGYVPPDALVKHLREAKP
jgi:thiol:disulfide interchange protein DsbC